MKEFLARAGWGDADVTPLPGDASTRRYARLTLGGARRMLMDQPQDAEAPAAPDMPAKQSAGALGYNAVARLAGADCAPFRRRGGTICARAAWRRRKIHAADHAQGFVILEDFGDALFADVLAEGGDREENCIRPQSRCWRSSMPNAAPACLAADMPLYVYDETALLAETDLLTEWFLPLALGRTATASEIDRASRAVARGAGQHRRQPAGVRAPRLSRPESDLDAGARGLGRVGLDRFPGRGGGSARL